MTRLDGFARLLGGRPAQSQIQALLGHAVSSSLEPEVKAYPDVVYHNYRSIGLSLQFEVSSPGKNASKVGSEDLCLAAIDIYSANEDKSWTCFPTLPLQIDALRDDTASEQVKATITKAITGKDLVSSLGEPQRKGGGAGGRSGPAAWMEWSLKLDRSNLNESDPTTLQIELAGAGARGADRWNAERAGNCKWAVITVSPHTTR
ncbi:uncharacterized protein UBRO_05976 [Ustilago bromivora]|uniref:Uncharacterized protein n=1 Tax=Ustilago bromivora TaxID=307758 RepID=A0A1K0GAC4_9BASI|nr:uncharacterized protein UBRO_05976 [Ustilago bromivora]SYW75769.1 uncharacterized protein UBRO2_00924 [Ustilago bromivora]